MVVALPLSSSFPVGEVLGVVVGRRLVVVVVVGGVELDCSSCLCHCLSESFNFKHRLFLGRLYIMYTVTSN
jgi:hypothetical protein